MVLWHGPDTQCPVVLSVQGGEGWSDLGEYELLGGFTVGGSRTDIDVLDISRVEMFPVLY